MADLMTVKGTLSDNRVALWERDDRHPNGEAFIAGDGLAQVYPTPAVKRRLADGLLTDVTPTKPVAKPKADKTDGDKGGKTPSKG